MSKSYLFYGAGCLAESCAKLLRCLDPEDSNFLVAVTRSASRKEQLATRFSEAKIFAEELSAERKFDYVVVCLPWKQTLAHLNETYSTLVACTKTNGRIVFVSTTGVFSENEGSWVSINSQLVKGHPYLEAEAKFLKDPRCRILRLAGLYNEHRGPHLFYLRNGAMGANPFSWLNLIHYDDAAEVVLSLLKDPGADQISLASDSHPVLRQDFFELLEEYYGSDLFRSPEAFRKPESEIFAGKKILSPYSFRSFKDRVSSFKRLQKK